MTLPFRRRHHDDEAGHDRARALVSSELLGPLGEDESAWLADHLSACADCQRDREAYAADRELLRALRDRAPEPPRDLWAKTSAALDREAGRRSRTSPEAADRRGRSRGGWRGLPLGAAAGVLILLVVIGTQSVEPSLPPTVTPGRSPIAFVTPAPAPTQINIAAQPVAYIRPGADGSWSLYTSDIDAVCPRSEPSCRPQLDEGPAQHLSFGGKPSTAAISPSSDQIVMQSGEGSDRGRIIVVPVSDARPPSTPVPPSSPVPSSLPATAGPSSSEPSTAPDSPEPTPLTTPTGQIEIATGVTVVGDVAYSRDGTWLAFSARPLDGSTGPDLYLWSVGAPSAVAVTDDHQTYFSTWLGDQVLASTIDVPEAPVATGEPTTTGEPATSEGPASDAPAADPQTSESPGTAVEAHPVSFVLDPGTLARTDLTQPDVWLPVVDSSARFVAYWSGTLLSSNGQDWELGAGQLVLDRWSSGDAPTEPQATPDASPDPAGASADPEATAGPAFGPQGTGISIVPGPTSAFNVRFDPGGTRLAVWVAEQPDAAIGRLSLLVLDPETGALGADPAPLAGEPALLRFSIDVGRLAWVSPDGQDGQQSAVKVLGWSNDDFGEIETLPARDLYIVR